ncbi:MAG: hypothetical protein J0I84_13625 [Terrimonas sp.]|nr:hypothetical protein [Terrimonas sp.]OJY92218.1 MAG: hypothetical protein BGP13_08640 [Sphingobacteriales bacterium 40-81]
MQQKTKAVLILLLVGAIINVFFIFSGIYNRKKFEKRGVIILAKIVSKKASDNEILLSCVYRFKNTEYNIVYPQQRMHEKSDSLVFLYILPYNPKKWLQLDKYLVPYCLSLDKVPDTGWKSLPLDFCK